jgi:histidyl-tRNA synthetase
VASDEVDDAAPLEAVKWSFVRRRASGLLQAHGYREVAPPPLELRGTHLLARSTAWPVGDDLELRADPILSLAQLYARARRSRSGDEAPLVRWMLSDMVFDPAAKGAHRYPAWHAIAATLFGADGEGPELESALLAQRLGLDLGLAQPALRVSFGGPAERAQRLRTALADLRVSFVEQPDGDGFALELLAHPDEGAPIAVLRGRRHDGLLAALGERPAPLFGLVLGVRRAASCTPGGAESYESAAEVFFVVVDPAARLRALTAANRERARGLRVEVELRNVPRDAQWARAAALRARAVVEFVNAGEVALLRMADETQPREVLLADLSSALRRLLR